MLPVQGHSYITIVKLGMILSYRKKNPYTFYPLNGTSYVDKSSHFEPRKLDVKYSTMESGLAQTGNIKSVMGWGVRGWVEIVEMILEICQKGALKTHVMYMSNLNSKQIAQYLDFLKSSGLVMSQLGNNEKRPIFKTTERGLQYIKAYKQLESLFKT